MGRKKGGHNKPKINNFNTQEPLAKIQSGGSIGNFGIKRGRGRPKGSKGKPKIREAEQAVPDKANIIPVDTREIKKQIRMIRKIKKDTHKKTAERRELNEKIRILKARLLPVQIEVTPEKLDIIKKILERRPEYTILKINLEQYTLEQLKLHYDRILTKTRLI